MNRVSPCLVAPVSDITASVPAGRVPTLTVPRASMEIWPGSDTCPTVMGEPLGAEHEIAGMGRQAAITVDDELAVPGIPDAQPGRDRQKAWAVKRNIERVCGALQRSL